MLVSPVLERVAIKNRDLKSLFNELKRRKVFRVAAAYIVFAWLMLQVVDVVVPMLELPNWVGKLVLLLLIVGLPIGIFFAWAFELTSEGLKRDLAGDAIAAVPTAETAAPTSVAADRKSIAILPFENLSQDAANVPFTMGVHDDLITQISKIGSIKTISRTSVMQYRETTKSIPEIALDLGVATVLEGGIQKAGDRVHVNVQLIDATTDHHLWADTYERQLTAENVFAIQAEIATSVARALHAKLSSEQKDQLASVPTISMPALEEYFAGRQAITVRTVDALKDAAKHYARAIELDPTFALAYVGLADATQLQYVYGSLQVNEMRDIAEPLIRKALQLDDRLGEARTSLGGLKYQLKDFEGSEAEFKLAIDLNPNYATAYHWYGSTLIDGFDRVIDAFAMFSKAAELDPLSCTHNINLGVVHDVLGETDAALRQYHRVIEIDPAYAVVYPHIGFVHWEAYGDLITALPWFKKSIELSPGSPNYPAYLALLYLDLGQDREAERWVKTAIELGPAAYRPNVAKALLGLYRRDVAENVECATRALNGKPNVWWGWAALAQLRNDDLRAGRADTARVRYEQMFPTLLDNNEILINRTNFRVAIDYALVLAGSGEQRRANTLLDRSLAFIRTIPRMGQEGHWVSDAAIYSLRGDTNAALAALREAIGQGWRSCWWYYLRHDPNFDTIRSEREFQAMVQELESDMANQLARP
jgi:TolB-like protein/Tfp pilus assembly protein PilF